MASNTNAAALLALVILAGCDPNWATEACWRGGGVLVEKAWGNNFDAVPDGCYRIQKMNVITTEARS